MDSSRVRVSIADLAWYIKILQTHQRYKFGILNPKKLKEGKRQYMALGGGVALKESGKVALEQAFGATDFELDKGTGFYDARFQIDRGHLEAVFNVFRHDQRPIEFYEQGRTLDIKAELSGREFPGYGCILSEKDLESVQFNFVQTVKQKPSDASADTSERVSAEIPTRRLFRICELVLPARLFEEKIAHSAVVKLLTTEELMTTEGGSQAGKTKSGHIIQNNLFYVPWVR